MKTDYGSTEKTFSLLFTVGIATAIILSAVLTVLIVTRSFKDGPTPDTGVPFTADDGGTQTGEGNTYSRQDGGYCFLLVGTDRVAGLADTIVLVRFDTASGSISAVQIPRDTYAEYGGASSRINAALPALGVEGLRDFLERSLCINIDYYALVDPDALIIAVNAIGGVTLDVPCDMDYEDPEQNLYIHLKAGVQTLTGETAQQFVRFRSGYATGDLGRINAQKIFISALIKKVRNELTPAAASDILRRVLPLITTDLPVDDCLYFASRLVAAGGNPPVLLTAPGKQLYDAKNGEWFYILSRLAMLETVNQYLNVYTEPVGDSLFDTQRAYVRDGDDAFERIYTYDLIHPEPVEG